LLIETNIDKKVVLIDIFSTVWLIQCRRFNRSLLLRCR